MMFSKQSAGSALTFPTVVVTPQLRSVGVVHESTMRALVSATWRMMEAFSSGGPRHLSSSTSLCRISVLICPPGCGRSVGSTRKRWTPTQSGLLVHSLNLAGGGTTKLQEVLHDLPPWDVLLLLLLQEFDHLIEPVDATLEGGVCLLAGGSDLPRGPCILLRQHLARHVTCVRRLNYVIACHLKLANSTVILASAHLPHSGHGPVNYAIACDQVTEVLQGYRYVVLGVDANACVDSSCHAAVGDFTLGDLSDNSYQFCTLATRCELGFPTTYHPTTYLHPPPWLRTSPVSWTQWGNRLQRQIDFILTSLETRFAGYFSMDVVSDHYPVTAA
eukprot:5708245-Amphidinium_carterae.2